MRLLIFKIKMKYLLNIVVFILAAIQNNKEESFLRILQDKTSSPILSTNITIVKETKKDKVTVNTIEIHKVSDNNSTSIADNLKVVKDTETISTATSATSTSTSAGAADATQVTLP